MFRTQRLECSLLWARRHNKPEFSNSLTVVLDFWFLHIWRLQRDFQPRWLRRGTRKYATWWYSGFCFGPVFWLSWQASWPDSLEGGTNSSETATGWGKALGLVPSQDLPQQAEEETDHHLGLPGRKHHIGRTGDSGEGRHCDSLWKIVNAWLLIERGERIFFFFFFETAKSILFVYAMKNN